MKAINSITPEETKSVLTNKGRLSRFFIALFVLVIMLAIAAPVNASTGSSKTKHSGCRLKKVTRTYPVILTGKNRSMVYNKNQKKARERNFSFPV